MAYLVGHSMASVGNPGDVHSSALNPVGKRASDASSNEYIYLKGVANTAIGSWVTYDELFLTTLLDSDGVAAQGAVAIATAATIANTWGWYQIFGLAQGLALTLFADDGIVYQSATAGSVDDSEVTSAISLVHGAFGRSAVNETTLLATFQLNYPHVSIGTID